MSKSLLILGAGGHGFVIKEVAEACGYDKIDFLDDNNPSAIGRISEFDKIVRCYDEYIIGIGNNKIRKMLSEKVGQNGCIATLIHPSAYISPSCSVGKGTVVEPKAIINARSLIGKGCIISVGSIVDHDAIIGNYTHINAGAIIKAGGSVDSEIIVQAGDIVSGF